MFLAYKDWAKNLHISRTDHKDVQILAATFCSCTRGLWMQRARALFSQVASILREVVLPGELMASYRPNVGTQIAILLDQRVEVAMGQYTQQYQEATSGMLTVYHSIIRTNYRD